MKDSFTFTSAAKVYFKTFKQFISEVEIEEVTPGAQGYAKYPVDLFGSVFGGSAQYEGQDRTWFHDKLAKLEPITDKNIKNQLFRVVDQIQMPYPNNLQMAVEDITVESLMEYGNPTMMVNVDSRTWMVANPKDFRILKHKSKDYAHLVCKHPRKNKIYKVEK